jgi:DNA-directed RNA polymerase I subunit RPA1
MQNGKTLPCYLPYDPNPRSSGYVTDRFISGLRPQDFYFHCMAGREGLIDTAVKTSRSGYLQRCLIKQLESLIVNYDMTVRDNDGSIIQFLYGDDGIDVMNSKYLDRFQFLEQNFSSILANSNGHDILQRVDQVSVD